MVLVMEILLYKENLKERMEQLDRDASLMFQDSVRYHVVIVGGGALMLMGYTSRATHDIDILSTSKLLYDLFWKYDMNDHVTAYSNNFPYNYEDRLTIVHTGAKIDFYTASLEDIVIAKLCANRPQDNQDVEEVAKYINWDVLERLAHNEDELKSSILNDRNYNDFLYSYNEYVKRHKL